MAMTRTKTKTRRASIGSPTARLQRAVLGAESDKLR